jgi:signal transduction histidine kinase
MRYDFFGFRQSMSSAPSAESLAESLATRLHAARSLIARQWLEQLNEILPVDRRDVFPGEQLLDHIPQLIIEIAGYLRAPETEAIAANTAVMAKAAELGLLRYSQRASVHQLLREYHLLGTLLERFITEAVADMGAGADAVGALHALSRVAQCVRVLQQQTVDTFVGKYSETIERQTAQLRGFTRLVSHEIRQPLGVLQLVARVLPATDPASVPLIEMLARNVTRLGDVAGKLERLARFSRANDADTPTEQEVDLTALARDVQRQLEDMAAARGVRVVVDDDLPRIITDGGRAELVLVNMIANAIKYADPDKADRFVMISRTPGSGASIVVQDNGIGIAPGKAAAIFEQFIRAHADRDEELGAQGLGLGLAIVRESMEAMGGSVTVTSEEGVGTAFTLTWATD